MSKAHRDKSTTGRTDWTRIDALSDDDIERMAEHDVDNPTSAPDDWAHASIGMPVLKTPVNANFDRDVVAWFKAEGRGYQARMNTVLRHYMETHRDRRRQ